MRDIEILYNTTGHTDDGKHSNVITYLNRSYVRRYTKLQGPDDETAGICGRYKPL